jgi:putative ABC transport system permease protein
MDYLDTSIRYSNLLTIDRNPYEAGMELYHGKEPALIVSMNFAKTFHTKIGDFIELKTPTGNFKLKIVATIVDFSNPKGVIYLKRELYKEYFKDPLVNFFGLHFEKGFESAESRTAVINEIDAKLGQKFNLMITSNAEIKKQMLDKVDQSFGFMRAVEVAALTVALLGILNTLLVSVMERTREIGLMRAVGMEQKQVFSLIMRESFFQGLLGSLVAIMLGSWISYSWLTKSLSAVLGWIVDFHYPWASIASTISLGVIVALIAGFIPSRKAATLDIKEALEYE